jgi:hypothetical protein
LPGSIVPFVSSTNSEELRLAGITTAEAVNQFLRAEYIPRFNQQFQAAAAE